MSVNGIRSQDAVNALVHGKSGIPYHHGAASYVRFMNHGPARARDFVGGVAGMFANLPDFNNERDVNEWFQKMDALFQGLNSGMNPTEAIGFLVRRCIQLRLGDALMLFVHHMSEFTVRQEIIAILSREHDPTVQKPQFHTGMIGNIAGNYPAPPRHAPQHNPQSQPRGPLGPHMQRSKKKP